MRKLAGIGLLSAVVLLFQVTLTRLFSVAQFYHFAFLVISLALLGFGASGSLLAVWPRLRARHWQPLYALAVAPATVAAYLILNEWPFDSYAIAWDRAQVWRLVANLLVLAVPFTLAGALIGAALTDPDSPAGLVYGANMIGSALGAMAAPLLLVWLGDARIVLACSALAGGAALLLADRTAQARLVRAAGILTIAASVGVMVAAPGALAIRPSPYKALSMFRQNPDATLAEPRYNAYSRLDIVRSPTIHSAPGLSMTYLGDLPPEIGLLLDGDSPMVAPQAAAVTRDFAQAMPLAVALDGAAAPDVLVLGLGGGLDAQIALALGARSVTGVEPNGLVVDALAHDLADWAGTADPRLAVIHQEIRAYAQQADRRFDVVQLALNDAYRPVTSGAFTLTENYVHTVEGYAGYLGLLREGGTLVIMRWLQNPPSEDLRTLGLIVAALERRGADPAGHIAAFRTFQTVTFLVKAEPFTAAEIERIVARAGALAYDMVLPPDVPPATVNRHAQIETPIYHDTYSGLLAAPDRDAFYDAYDFEVRPTTDDRPFFFHFFKWRQTPDILDNLGRTWQPFGGSGYFVLVALLAFATAAAVVFVVLPVGLRGRFRRALRGRGAGTLARIVAYFAALGLAFLLVEVATIQQFVLLLGQPTLAITTVIASLLLFSGVGSALSDRLPWSAALATLVGVLAVWPWLLAATSEIALPLPLGARVAVAVLVLLPPGFLMGIPFARGLTAIRREPELVPWAWAINGGASVISAVVAALLALSFGFRWVLWVGAALYALAWLTRPPRA